MAKQGRPSSAPAIAPKDHKWCPYGKHYLKFEEFPKMPNGTYQSYCRKCKYEYNKKRGKPGQKYRNLRKRVLEFLGGECIWCGENEPKALIVDHIDPELGYLHRKRMGWQSAPVYRDALKQPEHYQLLCRNCHVKIKHKKYVQRGDDWEYTGNWQRKCQSVK